MKQQRTAYFLMANLGSELVRFFNLKQKGESGEALNSAERAFDLMRQLKAHHDIGHGAQEVAILESVLRDALTNSPQYLISSEELHCYFAPFAGRVLERI